MFLFRGDLCIEGDTVFSNESRSLIQARTIYRDACSACFCVFTPLYVDLTCFQRAASMPYCAVSCRVHNLPPIYINHQPRCPSYSHALIHWHNKPLPPFLCHIYSHFLPPQDKPLLTTGSDSLSSASSSLPSPRLLPTAIFRGIEGASPTTSMMPFSPSRR